MKYIKTSFIVLGFALSSLSYAQEVTRLTASKLNQFGLIYSLPNTVLDFEVVAVKTTAKAGPYHKYAEKFLGVPVTITEDMETWSLKNVNVTSHGVSDSEKRYLVQFKSGSAPYMYMDKNGLLLSVNAEPKIEPTPLTTAATAKTPSPLDNNAYASVFTEELLMSGSTAKMAEIAAKQLYRIRESRLNLATGEAEKMPADGESFKLVMKQLDEQETALVALFLGTTQTETVVQRFSLQPTGDRNNEVVFRFSELLGVVDKNNLGGAPVYLNIIVTEKGSLPTDTKGKPKELPKGGLAYCIPGKAKVDVQFGGKTIFSGNFQIAQFGVTYALTPDMLEDKKAPAKVIFYPQTGAIREILK